MASLFRLFACLVLAAAPAAGRQTTPITFESLLKEMVDRDSIARFPDPPYTCKQFSSYDRASTSPADARGWFANGDANQYLRTEDVPLADGASRKEWVMADMAGPGAIVRVWSANPKGTLRVYLDGAAAPVIEAPMADFLGGKWLVAPPLSRESSRGWNTFLPIPYAKHCKITSDQGGFYYQVNYRTYPAGTTVESLAGGTVGASRDALDAVLALLQPEDHVDIPVNGKTLQMESDLGPGESSSLDLPRGEGCIRALVLQAHGEDLAQAMRSLVISAEFDGTRTIWCPVSDFFAQGVGNNEVQTWWIRSMRGGGAILFPMPYKDGGAITVTNHGKEPAKFRMMAVHAELPWDDRSMHFHSTWRAEYPIHAYGGRGTTDWNYAEITGRGVYAGDSLAVMNPIGEWWGEGDEKIYVDGEAFPSHFGTGTEDYYGYAWCSNIPFQHPFHSQPRCDGQPHGNNWGHTTVNRFRSLDAIPFTSSLRFDMEVWHWKECDVAYAATTYFYARPGTTTNRVPMPDEAARANPRPPPLPPPFRIEGAVECEKLRVAAKSEGLTVVPQDMRGFAARKWSGESHLWIQGRKPGDFVELEIPTGEGPEGQRPVKLTLHATRSWDYGVVRFTVNGKPAGRETDLYSGQQGRALPSGPIELGMFTPIGGKLTLRAEVVGGNEQSAGTRSFFGLDCVILTPVGD